MLRLLGEKRTSIPANISMIPKHILTVEGSTECAAFTPTIDPSVPKSPSRAARLIGILRFLKCRHSDAAAEQMKKARFTPCASSCPTPRHRVR